MFVCLCYLKFIFPVNPSRPPSILMSLGCVFGPRQKACCPVHSDPAKSSILFFKFIFYWSMVGLQCCVNYCCTAKWLSYTYIYTLFHILFLYGLSQDIDYSSLCYTLGPCCLSILSVIVCIYQKKNVSMCITESLCCTEETGTTL